MKKAYVCEQYLAMRAIELSEGQSFLLIQFKSNNSLPGAIWSSLFSYD